MTTAVSATLIGRSAPYERLRSTLARASEGAGGIAFVSGEAGIGKTHLVTRLLDDARSAGAIVASGGCPVRSEGDLPFAAPMEAWRSLARGTAGLPEPEVRRTMAALADRMSADEPVDPADRGPFGQVRLLDAWSSALHAIGRADRPVVVAFEDVHWADRGTRDLIAYLARTCRDGHILVILTHRSDELPAQDPLRGLLAELIRLPWTERIELTRLSPDEVALMAAERLGRPLSSTDAESLARRSGGVPYYVEELVEQAGAGGPPPTTIREHLLHRVAAVGPEVRLVVGLAAAVGRPCRPKLIAAASGLSPMIAAAAIEEALDRRLLAKVPTADGSLLATHHELLRETIDYEIVRPAGFDLHRRLADALAADPRLAGATELEQSTLLADQAARADLRVVATAASLRAAAAAEALHLFDEAAARWAAALDLAPGTEVAAEIDIRRHLAESAFLADDPETAVSAIRPAIDLLLAAGDARAAAAALGRLGSFRAATGDARGALESLDQALDLLAVNPASDVATRIHLTRARAFVALERPGDADTAAAAALETADAVGDSGSAAAALELRGAIAARRGDLASAADLLDRAATLRRPTAAGAAPRPSRIADVLLELADRATILERTGRVADAEALRASGAERARELGASAAWTAFLDIDLARRAAALGRYDEALATVDSVPDGPARRAGHRLDVLRARIAVGAGRYADAEAALERVRIAGLADEPGAAAVELAAVTADLAVWRGRADAALAAVEAATGDPDVAGDPEGRAELLAIGLRAAGDLAELARFRRRPSELDSVRDRATPLEVAARAALDRADPRGRVAALLALALAESARVEGSAAGSWGDPIAALEGSGDPVRAAYARFRRAEAALGADPPDRRLATDDLTRAAAVADGAGARALLREIDDLARRSRVSLDQPAGGPEREIVVEEGAGAAAEFGLSPRELEVLALIADGRTNRQIAETLFITEKTAAHHVSNLMGKLDVTTRGEAAAMARRLRLLPDASLTDAVD